MPTGQPGSHMAPHEYALPKPGRIPREEAWRILSEHHQGLVIILTARLVDKLTEGGSRAFTGLEGRALFDEFIGAAQECALIAIENWDSTKGKITTIISTVFNRRMQRVVDNLQKERGPETKAIEEAGLEKMERRSYIRMVGRRLKPVERVGDYGDEKLPLEYDLMTALTEERPLEKEPVHRATKRTRQVLKAFSMGRWVDAGDFIDAREDYLLGKLTPGGRGEFTRQLRSLELT